MNSPLHIGAQLPTSKGFEAALDQAQSLGLNCLQLFSKSPRQWKAAPLDETKTRNFTQKWRESGFGPLVIHDSYLINLAAPVDETREKSVAAMIDEIERAHVLGADFLVTHCGAHLGSGEEAGVERLAQSLQICLEKTADLGVKIALENTCAQGTCLGGPFWHIGKVLQKLQNPRLVVCFDSCHAHAAGHDLGENLEGVLSDFDAQIGLENLAVIHFNDGKGALGKHLDRHEHIGEGQLGKAALRGLLNHPKTRDLPFILETPEVETQIAKNIAAVRELRAV